MKKIYLFALVTITTLAAGESNAMIVYGDDNRVEPFEATEVQKKLSISTAGMVENMKLIDTGDNVLLPPFTIADDIRLCKDEKFSEQASPITCSGFLVAPKLLVTAGHCIPNQIACGSVSWVFDYKVEAASGRAKVMVPKSKVYKCHRVIEARLQFLENDAKDYALIELDRAVYDRAPLKVRTSGKIEDHSEIFVVGHPSGLPLKIAGDAQVVDNSAPSYFKTNLDTFGGNSGSAVFNAKTGVVEGILVRGSKDYYKDKDCFRVFNAPQDLKPGSRLGESVSRITDIKSLSYLMGLLPAVHSSL